MEELLYVLAGACLLLLLAIAMLFKTNRGLRHQLKEQNDMESANAALLEKSNVEHLQMELLARELQEERQSADQIRAQLSESVTKYSYMEELSKELQQERKMTSELRAQLRDSETKCSKIAQVTKDLENERQSLANANTQLQKSQEKVRTLTAEIEALQQAADAQASELSQQEAEYRRQLEETECSRHRLSLLVEEQQEQINHMKQNQHHTPEGKADPNLRPWFGVAVKWVDDLIHGGKSNMAIVHQVIPESPAHKAGIQIDDQLEYWGPVKLESETAWKTQAGKLQIGDVLDMGIVRNHRSMRVTVRIVGTARDRPPRRGIHLDSVHSPNSSPNSPSRRTTSRTLTPR